MSANNQILIKKYEDHYYIFEVIAESWSDENELPLSKAEKSFIMREEAFAYAKNMSYETEYGFGEILIKDGADVTIINDNPRYGLNPLYRKFRYAFDTSNNQREDIWKFIIKNYISRNKVKKLKRNKTKFSLGTGDLGVFYDEVVRGFNKDIDKILNNKE
ncbi:MAG: hypothetical protein M0Q13_15390 [Methanothrix sp.]|jgi:hypothetical protein|nr:hypothetical protein [Methanothrix sp.]